MGHPIHEFNTPIEVEESQNLQVPIEEDKENDQSYLKTPLKIPRKEIRSPLQDITPSMTQKKI